MDSGSGTEVVSTCGAGRVIVGWAVIAEGGMEVEDWLQPNKIKAAITSGKSRILITGKSHLQAGNSFTLEGETLW